MISRAGQFAAASAEPCLRQERQEKGTSIKWICSHIVERLERQLAQGAGHCLGEQAFRGAWDLSTHLRHIPAAQSFVVLCRKCELLPGQQPLGAPSRHVGDEIRKPDSFARARLKISDKIDALPQRARPFHSLDPLWLQHVLGGGQPALIERFANALPMPILTACHSNSASRPRPSLSPILGLAARDQVRRLPAAAEWNLGPESHFQLLAQFRPS